MRPPLAYFSTWSTYGTRLHGDSRGTVDRDHNGPRGTYVAPSDRRMEYERRMLAHEPVIFTSEMRGSVESTIRDHCHRRKWTIAAMNVRTNHVHVIVRGAERKRPEDVMGEFKAWSTRRLREAGLMPTEGEVWTFHGSTRWINTEASLAEAIDYVLQQQ